MGQGGDVTQDLVEVCKYTPFILPQLPILLSIHTLPGFSGSVQDEP
jgi:hypothetical protein